MPPGIAELCEPFKRDKLARGVALVAGRPECIKLLTAFALFPLPVWRAPRSRMPDDGRQRWLWLWSGYDGGPMRPRFLDSVWTVAGISSATAYRVWPSLMVSRVLYPDGTLSDEAQALLQAHIVKSLPRPPPEPRAAPEPRQPKIKESKNGTE
jgi:hypothetical protein